jgi:hypothetical protein
MKSVMRKGQQRGQLHLPQLPRYGITGVLFAERRKIFGLKSVTSLSSKYP